MSERISQVRQVVVHCAGKHQDSNWHFECEIEIESGKDCLQWEERSMKVVGSLFHMLQMVAMAKVPGNDPFLECCTRRVWIQSREWKQVGKGGQWERLDRAVLLLRKPCSLWFETKTRSRRILEVKRGRREQAKGTTEVELNYHYCIQDIKRVTISRSRTKKRVLQNRGDSRPSIDRREPRAFWVLSNTISQSGALGRSMTGASLRSLQVEYWALGPAPSAQEAWLIAPGRSSDASLKMT